MMLQPTVHLMHHRKFRVATQCMLTKLMQRPKRQSAWKADANKGLLLHASYQNIYLRRGQCCEAPERCPRRRIPGLQISVVIAHAACDAKDMGEPSQDQHDMHHDQSFDRVSEGA